MGADSTMLKSGHSRATDGLSYDGCSCHNDKATRRRAERPAKRAEKRQWQAEIEED